MNVDYRTNHEAERHYADVPAVRRYDLLALTAFFTTTAIALASMM